jgi:hypothetical protein
MRRLAGFGITLIAMVIGSSAQPGAAGAQCNASGAGGTCNQAGSVTMTAGRVVRLQTTAASTALTPPTPTDFDNGFNATTGPTLTVSSNTAWTLHIRSAATFWTAANTSPGAPARTTKPAADLRWSTSVAGTFTALTTTDVNLVTGAATASSVTTLFLRTFYNWTLDTPGNYSLAVVLTLTAP